MVLGVVSAPAHAADAPNGVTKGPYTLSALTAFMYFDKVAKLPDATS